MIEGTLKRFEAPGQGQGSRVPEQLKRTLQEPASFYPLVVGDAHTIWLTSL